MRRTRRWNLAVSTAALIRDTVQNGGVRPENLAHQSTPIVIATLLDPPAEIDLDRMVPRPAEEVERAVQAGGLVP